MIIYRCGECGDDISHHDNGQPRRLRLEAHLCSGATNHFCSIGCLTDWAAESGYRDDDG